MLAECEFDQVVLFDLPVAHADTLLARLQESRLAWPERTEDGLFVVAALRIEPEDLARLLRDAQTWLAEGELPYLIFVLDGREYELRAPAEALAGSTA
jgi:hypothetical protein